MRNYQGALRLFGEFITDARYAWAAECERRVGAVPVQVCHEWNTVDHVAEFEGRPQRRALSSEALFDARRNPRAEAYGQFGSLQVRYGKSSHGAPPKRRTMLTVPEMDWVVDVQRQWRDQVHPGSQPAPTRRCGSPSAALAWVCERWRRRSPWPRRMPTCRRN